MPLKGSKKQNPVETDSDGENVQSKVAVKPSKTRESDAPVPSEVAEKYQQLKNLIRKRTEISKGISSYKKENNYPELVGQIRAMLDALFDYMEENDLDRIGSYSREFCKPSNIKKEERTEKKKEAVEKSLRAASLPEKTIEKILEELSL